MISFTNVQFNIAENIFVSLCHNGEIATDISATWRSVKINEFVFVTANNSLMPMSVTIYLSIVLTDGMAINSSIINKKLLYYFDVMKYTFWKKIS